MTAVSAPAAFPVTLIGHPFATVGMGEQLRSHIAACQSVHLPHTVVDIYRYASRSDPDHRKLVEYIEADVPSGGIRIFHINGDEVELVVRTFEARGGNFADGYNIIVPAWELPVYPAVWAEQLRQFNEIWALSHFIEDSLAAVGIPSVHIGQPVEVPLGHFLPRKYFGIRESAFIILHFFDLSSHASRKNPEAVLRMFEAIKAKREYQDIQLVLKVKRGDEDGEDWIRPIRDRVPEACFLSKPMSSLETRSLINCCDCFVSLHRAEGFGRGTGEAMFMGRLAMATAWSGNMDYMTKENSLLVDYDLVPVGAGDYPFGEGQHWANARVNHAVALLDAAIGDLEQTRIMAANGRRAIRLDHGYRAVGVRVLDRVTAIVDALSRIEASVEVISPVEDVPEELDGLAVIIDDLPPTEDSAELTSPGDDVPKELDGLAVIIDDLPPTEDSAELTSPGDDVREKLAAAADFLSSDPDPETPPADSREPSVVPDKSGRRSSSARHQKKHGRTGVADRSVIPEGGKVPPDAAE